MKKRQPARSRKSEAPPPAVQPTVPLVALGPSAGGLEACSEWLRRLPMAPCLSFVVVRPPEPEPEPAGDWAARLARTIPMPVRAVAGHTPIEAHHVYVVPPNATVNLAPGVLQLQAHSSAERYCRLFEAVQDGLLLLDPATHHVLDANPFMTQLLGRTREELQGKTPCELGLFPSREACLAFFQQLRQQGYLRKEDLPLVTKTGERRAVEFISNLYEEEGVPLIQCTVRDITERKRVAAALQESEMRFRAAFESGAIAMALTSMDSRLLDVNPAFCRLLGFSKAELVGRAIAEITHPEDLAANVRGAQQLASGQIPSLRLEKRYLRKDGTVIWGDMSTAAVRDAQGRPLYCVTHVQDITERKDVQAGLERLVAERTAKLQELVGELEHFSYTLAHDMRAPLRAMEGYAELMSATCTGRRNAQAVEFLRRIRRAVERMDALIVDALNYNRAVREQLTLTPVDPGALLRGMLDSYPELHPSRAHIDIRGELPPVLANEAGLTQCFSNLLDNAVKFVKPGQQPQIVIWAEVRGRERERTGAAEPAAPEAPLPGPRVRIWVEDQGIGIPESMLPRVFDMFTRGQHTYAGTGIGLALVRKVAERMGGKVGVESKEGKGSRFWVELQSAAPWALAHSPAPASRCAA